GGVGGAGRPGYVAGSGGLGSVARSGAIAGRSGTVAVNRQTLVNQGNVVRNNFGRYGYGAFGGNWWGRYPNAWRAAGRATAGRGLGAATGAACSNWCSYPAEPVYYDYGSNVVYEGDTVYVNGDSVGTQEQYAEQAIVIADTGRQAEATKEEEW